MKDAGFGTFGSRPDDIVATDFYGFFHFGPVRTMTADDGATISSHRTSGTFRELVVLDVTTDTDRRIVELSLQVARAFVDDPRDGVFARDLVASFIREGSTGQGFTESFDGLEHDLRYRPFDRRDEVSYTDSNPLPPLPGLPGDLRPAFAVLRGTDASGAIDLQHTVLRMSNDHFDGTGALTVSFHRQDFLPALLSR